MPLKPAKLHAAVAPLWSRDPAFIPRWRWTEGRTRHDCALCLVNSSHDATWVVGSDHDGALHWLLDDAAAALIRERITERLGKLGWQILANPPGSPQPYTLTRPGKPRRAIKVTGRDRTLALINAAMLALDEA